MVGVSSLFMGRRFAFDSITRTIAGALVGIVLAASASAQTQEPVDVELVLAVDVSLSMSPMELDIQRDGYAAALVHDDVVKAIRQGAYGKIAVTYMEWAGDDTQRVVVPWTAIASRADAEAFVAQLRAAPPSSARRTSVSGALMFARDLFAESTFRGMKRVIDVSGDGPNNQGPPIEGIRDELVGMGIVINGLPLMTSGGGVSSAYDIVDLDKYYSDCVIGGPGSFMIPVNDWSAFPEAVRRKLVMEIGQAPAPAFPLIRIASSSGYDCMIGEKIWSDRNWMWRN